MTRLRLCFECGERNAGDEGVCGHCTRDPYVPLDRRNPGRVPRPNTAPVQRGPWKPVPLTLDEPDLKDAA